MKVIIEKKIEDGRYSVQINISNYTQEEIEKIKKFGSPKISIAPKSIFLRGGIRPVNILPLHGMDYNFDFGTEAQAISFVDSMTERISNAVANLKNMTDDFSGKKELEL